MTRIQYRGLKILLLFFALLGLFDSHQVLANSCKSLLSPPWHIAGEQKSEDMKLLTELEFKVQRDEELSLEELRFLYEIDRKIQGFGYGRDPRIDEMISQRDKNKDYALIFNVKRSEVTSKKEDVLSGEAKVFIGTLELKPNDNLSRVRLEAIVDGEANFNSLTSAKGLGNLSYIGSHARFKSLKSAEGLENLSYIGGIASFGSLTSAEGLGNLSYIGNTAYLRSLTSAKGLKRLQHIGGEAGFSSLTSAEGLENLSHIGWYADFSSLTSAEGLNINHIGNDADFSSLTSVKGLNISHIGGKLTLFNNLKDAEGLENLSRVAKERFGIENELKELSVQFDPKETNGEWVKYEQGNKNHAKALFNSLQNQNTGWCIANACSTLTHQIEYGDFYVYYSKDFEGEFSVPRIAIRMNGESIAEVRGTAKANHLDSEMLKTSILEDKLKEFGNEEEKFKQKSEDMKLLTELEFKVQRSEDLSPEDLRFLHEIDRKIQGFGYGRDPRIDEMISQRDKNKDYALIFKVRESEVSSKKEDVLSGEAKVFVGDLKLEPWDDLSRVQLKAIAGNARLDNLTSAEGLENLTHISGYAYFESLTSAEGLENLKYAVKGAYFGSLTSAKGLKNLSYVGGSVSFFSLTSAKGLENLSYIGGPANFKSLTSAEGLENLSHIGGDAFFNNLTNAEGLKNLSHIGGDAFFNNLTNAEGLKNLSHIGGDAFFNNLTNAEGLKNLSHIGGDAFFNNLTNAEGLKNLSHIGGDAFFRSLTKGLLKKLYIKWKTYFKK